MSEHTYDTKGHTASGRKTPKRLAGIDKRLAAVRARKARQRARQPSQRPVRRGGPRWASGLARAV